MITFKQFSDDDLEIVWEAYKANSFNLPEMSKLHFIQWFANMRARYQEILIVREDTRPIALVVSFFDGWKYEPHVEFFSWANKRSILRSSVTFFTELAKLDTIGVVFVKCLQSSTNLFDHVCSKGCLEYIGMMPKGDYRGNEYIYSATGNAKSPADTRTHPTESICSA